MDNFPGLQMSNINNLQTSDDGFFLPLTVTEMQSTEMKSPDSGIFPTEDIFDNSLPDVTDLVMYATENEGMPNIDYSLDFVPVIGDLDGHAETDIANFSVDCNTSLVEVGGNMDKIRIDKGSAHFVHDEHDEDSCDAISGELYDVDESDKADDVNVKDDEQSNEKTDSQTWHRNFNFSGARREIQFEQPSTRTSGRVAKRRFEIVSSPDNFEEPPERIRKTSHMTRNETYNVCHDTNKNAIQARINRQKKKAYIESLEKDVSETGRENGRLKKELSEMSEENLSLVEEVAYLKSVLANQSVLAGLIHGINGTNTVELSSSFEASRRRPRDHDYCDDVKMSSKVNHSASPQTSGGVCLHVDKERVSMEFCYRCANHAHGGRRENL